MKEKEKDLKLKENEKKLEANPSAEADAKLSVEDLDEVAGGALGDGLAKQWLKEAVAEYKKQRS